MIVGLGGVAIGALVLESVSVPLPGGWHSTLFPRGIGVLVVVAGIGLVVVSVLLRQRRDR